MSAVTQAQCNVCGTKTNHDVLHEEKNTGSEVLDRHSAPIDWWDKYEMLRCRGCDTVTMRHTSYFSENSGPEGDEVTVTYYPPRMARRSPYWASGHINVFDFDDEGPSVPASIRDCMHEVYTAVQNGLPRLAAMGIRAALDGLMVDKVGDNRSFRGNLDAFHRAGYLSNQQREVLAAILEAGHAATHRGWVPTDNDITTLLDVTESLIEASYMHQTRARDIEKRVPKPVPKSEKPG